MPSSGRASLGRQPLPGRVTDWRLAAGIPCTRWIRIYQRSRQWHDPPSPASHNDLSHPCRHPCADPVPFWLSAAMVQARAMWRTLCSRSSCDRWSDASSRSGHNAIAHLPLQLWHIACAAADCAPALDLACTGGASAFLAASSWADAAAVAPWYAVWAFRVARCLEWIRMLNCSTQGSIIYKKTYFHNWLEEQNTWGRLRWCS